jgi:drug/metabolite transporter (DMT)-like permease
MQRGDVPRLLVVSLASVAGYHLSLNYAETIVSSGLAGLFNSLGPVFAVVLSALFLKEKIGLKLLLAIVLAVSGAAILSVSTSTLSFASLSGPLAAVFAAFMYGVFSVGSKPLVAKYGALQVATWSAMVGTTLLLPLASTELPIELVSLSTGGWISMLYLAIMVTVVGYTLFYALVGTRTVSILTVQLYLVPLVSVIGGATLLGEQVTVSTAVGGALLLGAIATATRSKK